MGPGKGVCVLGLGRDSYLFWCQDPPTLLQTNPCCSLSHTSMVPHKLVKHFLHQHFRLGGQPPLFSQVI